ncbi:Phage integrase family protein [Pseudomonas guineae]|uniref:Phage integrase family protein n=1 Tax=Pseudomonas guineae TaxID=425504 RepID=A0A1I3JQY7_9PSED|nr:DUF6538 domain-containing protein [Pseudomonas guineae]SFI62584.1 Phage integrase family protein [Pseudomonas guineae]
MAKANNLELQGGTYHVRLAVPKDVQKAFGGRRILSQSLKTGSRKEALDRRLPILAEWKAKIKAAREGIPLPEGWQNDLISLHTDIGQMFSNQKLALVGVPAPPLPTINPDIEARMKSNPRLVAAFENLAEEHLKDGLEGKVRLMNTLAKAFQGMIPKAYIRNFNLSAEQQEEVNAVLSDPADFKHRSPITKALLRQFREYRTAHNISAKNIDTQESRLNQLSSYLAKEGKELNFNSVASFIQTIERSPATQQQYVLAGGAFWKWAMRYSDSWRAEFKNSPSPFANHAFPKLKGKAKVEASRKHYELAEISKLHAGALSTDQPVLADLISLGYYTGARIEELCQLRQEHLIKVAGVLTFDITDSKTAAGIRQVPVHPALLPVVDRLTEASKDGWLLSIKALNKYGKRSDSLSKKFGRLRTSLGFSSNYVFHSLRMTTITQLVQADVVGTLIAELVGHETGTVTFDVYSQGASSKQKLEAISKLPEF